MFRQTGWQYRLYRPQAGFSLSELVIALAIGALLLAIATPSMQRFREHHAQVTAANAFVAILNHARSEAVTSGNTVTVCRSDNPHDALPRCSGSGGWESGWIAFIDDDQDGVFDAGEKLLRTGPALPDGQTLRGNSKVVSRISFRAYGTTGNNGSLALCDRRGWGTASRVIVITPAGRVRVANPAISGDSPIATCAPDA